MINWITLIVRVAHFVVATSVGIWLYGQPAVDQPASLSSDAFLIIDKTGKAEPA